jgi:hypothetical protein
MSPFSSKRKLFPLPLKEEQGVVARGAAGGREGGGVMRRSVILHCVEKSQIVYVGFRGEGVNMRDEKGEKK